MTPDTYTFTGDAVTFLGLLGVVFHALLLLSLLSSVISTLLLIVNTI